MKHTGCDVVIVGVRAGRNVRCLEATDRVGGRILTVHDPLAPLPVELVAEFVHGRPPETWDLIQAANLTAYEYTAKTVHIDRGRVITNKEAGELADKVLAKKAKSVRGAYSYTGVNALSAHQTLATPVEETLFFAGEATETKGHSGTVTAGSRRD